ncbi:MAG: sulfatase-like hydrolase/transferase [Chitinophagaceae bacterium]
MKSKNIFLLLFITNSLLISFPTHSQQHSKNTLPNIVFIVSDDHRWDALGVAGNAKIKTPVLDKLAREGVYFRQATTNISVCAPSRATLLTGLPTHQHGYFSNNSMRADMQWADSFSVPTMPGLLQQAGYRTILVGKWHLATQPWLTGFSEVRTWLPQAASSYLDAPLAKGNSRKTEIIKGFTNGIFADDAIAFLENAGAKEKPFFLWLSATIPHGPLQPNPPHIRQLYQGKTNADLIPPAFPGGTKANSKLDTTQLGSFRFVNYYEAVSYLDELVGQVLETLKKQGLAKNTIVVFIGDNGFMSGSRGINGKVVPWEESVRVPVIIYAPMFATVKGVNDIPVSSLDLPVTLLKMAGVSVPKNWMGRDVTPVLKGIKKHNIDYAVNEWVDTVYQYRNLAQRSIRTPHYKLIRWHRQDMPDEMYDLIADPHETTNIITLSMMRSVREKLSSQLNTWMTRTNDSARFWGKKNGKVKDDAAEAKVEMNLRSALKFTPVKVDPRVYDAYLGRYEFVTRFQVMVFKEGDKLFIQGDGDKSELIPKSETEFSNKGQTNRITFVKNEKGEVIYLVRRNSIDAGDLMVDMKGKKIE